MPDLAYVNGTFCDLADARVAVEDRGFQFADGVYEVVVAPAREPFLLDRHLQRLRQSAALIELNADGVVAALPAIIRAGIDRAGHPGSTPCGGIHKKAPPAGEASDTCMVPRDRIELPTRAFSIPCSTD